MVNENYFVRNGSLLFLNKFLNILKTLKILVHSKYTIYLGDHNDRDNKRHTN